MRVNDMTGKERDIKSVKKITHGGEPFVEVVINGKTRRWKEYWHLELFKLQNPNYEFEE